jgi:hypothetical protein
MNMNTTWGASAVAGREPKRSTMGCIVLVAGAVTVGELKKGLVLGPLLLVGDDTLAWKYQKFLLPSKLPQNRNLTNAQQKWEHINGYV